MHSTLRGAALVVALALALGGFWSATAKAAPPCPSKTMHIVAHQDDDLIFQSPNLLHQVGSEHCIRTIYLTAGDDGKSQAYWGAREEGVQAAYAQMAGVANAWTSSQTVAAGHSILTRTLTAMPSISLVFMRLPDGGYPAGTGTALYGFQSMMKLWNSATPGKEPSQSTITADDNSNTYSYAELTATLTALIQGFEPRQLDIQNYTEKFFEGDHPDHIAGAYFAREAQKAYAASHRLVGYIDYDTSAKPANVTQPLLGLKKSFFYTYAEHDDGLCGSDAECAGSEYEKWLERQYVAGTETTGVVANAGFGQIASAGQVVALDGSDSSDASGNPLSYQWTQTRGPTVSISGATSAKPAFTMPSHPTLLTFSLVVKDGITPSPPDSVNVRIPSATPNPTAVPGSAQNVSSGATVNLDGSGSWDPNSEPLTYAWTQTAGPAVTISGANTAKPSFTAPTGPTSVTVSLVVSNGVQSSTAAPVTISVKGIAPAITSSASTSFTTIGSHGFTVTTTGSPSPAISKTGALPSGVSFVDNGNGTATLSGTPAPSSTPPGTSREYPITIKALNSVSEATQSFVLTVVNNAPTITSAASTSFTTTGSHGFTVTTTGSPAAAIARTGALPSGVSFVDNGDGTATLSGTPAANSTPPGTSREYPISIKAENSSGEATQSFVLTVVNNAPTITTAASTSFTTVGPHSFLVMTTGLPAAAITKTGTLPGGVSFVDNGNGTATLSGTPAADSAPLGESREYPITIKAENSSGEATQAFVLTVVNNGPVITSANSTAFITGASGTFTVTTTGSPAAAITRTGELPEGVGLVDNGNGTATLSGIPAANSTPPGTSREYAITISAQNSSGKTTQAFKLHVANHAPAITSAASASFTTGTPGSFTVLALGTPPPALQRAGALPAGLAFFDNGDGTATLSGTPAPSSAPAGGVRTYPLTLSAENGSGSASQPFTLTIASSEPASPPPSPSTAPSISAPSTTFAIVGKDVSIAVGSSGTPVPSLAPSGALPKGLHFAATGPGAGTISGKPADAGTSQLTLVASNAAGGVARGVSLVVDPKPRLSKSKVSLPIGKRARHVVKVLAQHTSAVRCTGKLPQGARCRVRGNKEILVEGSAAVRRAGTYRLAVRVTARGGTVQQQVVVSVRR